MHRRRIIFSMLYRPRKTAIFWKFQRKCVTPEVWQGTDFPISQPRLEIYRKAEKFKKNPRRLTFSQRLGGALSPRFCNTPLGKRPYLGNPKENAQPQRSDRVRISQYCNPPPPTHWGNSEKAENSRKIRAD